MLSCHLQRHEMPGRALRWMRIIVHTGIVGPMCYFVGGPLHEGCLPERINSKPTKRLYQSTNIWNSCVVVLIKKVLQNCLTNFYDFFGVYFISPRIVRKLFFIALCKK